MSANTVKDIRATLKQLREAVDLTIDTLLVPYLELLTKNPEATIVEVRPIQVHDWDSPIAKMAEKIFEAGGSASPLFEVEKQETIIDQLVTEYRTSSPMTRGWFERLEPIRSEALAVIDAAHKETAGYEKLDFGRSLSTLKQGLKKDILAPKDLVEDLGIDVPAVRKRIRQGLLGPWSRKGGRWMILRKDFEAWLSSEAVEIKACRSSAGSEQRADILRLLERRKPRRAGGGDRRRKP